MLPSFQPRAQAFAEQVLRFDCDLIANAAKVKVRRF